MDKIKLVIVMVAIIVDEMNCDTDCDCKTIKELQESMQKEIFQNKLEISRMNSRIRNIEASKRHWTGTNNKASNKESDGLTTKSNTTDPLEAEVTSVGSTDVNKATIQSRLLKLIETKLSSLSLQVQDLKKHDSKEYLLETIVNKTLSSETRSRKKFETVLKNDMKNINNSVSEIRTETKGLMEKYNETFVKGCDNSIGALKEVTVNINKTMYEEINIITEALNDLTEKMSEANKKDGEWSSWENWGSCSVSCGGGIQSRLRTCSKPRPSVLGKYCDGSPDETRTCNKQQCAELKVAFTAYWLYSSPSSYTTLVFQSAYINYGNAYNKSTGEFTCKVPGLYHFSVTLTKAYGVKLSYVDAYLRINNGMKLRMWYNPYNDDKLEIGTTSLTQSGTFHLNKNDVVDIYGTPNNFIIYDEMMCTFTGYLITPD